MERDTVEALVKRIMVDEKFAARVQAMGQSVAKDGVKSTYYNEYLSLFATSPQKLAELKSAGINEGLTSLTILSATSAPCTCTTTTTTTTKP